MAEERLTENDDDELVIVETPDENLPAHAGTDEKPEPEDDEDDEDSDARLGESEDDNEEDVTTSTKTRERRLKRREMQRRAKERAEEELRIQRLEIQQLRQRLSSVEGHALTSSEAALQQQLAQAQEEYRQAEFIIAKASEAGNGEDVVAAMRIRDNAAARANQLHQSVQHFQQARQQAAQPQVDPGVVSYAQQWIAANPWYDPQGRDEDSRITKAIDDGLAKEGYDPRSRAYWEELTRRVESRVNGGEAASERSRDTSRRKAPPTGGGREHAPVSTRKEVHVTPERKQAMIDAGVWDDPAARQRYLKAYRDYDAQSAR